MILDKVFTSGWTFEDSQMNLKSKFQMINIGIILASISIIYGVVTNIIRDTTELVPIEIFIFGVNIILFVTLRIYKQSFEYVATILTAQFSFLMLLLVYVSDPVGLKHVWLYTYPIIILYFQRTRVGVMWTIFMLVMLLIAPLQSFVEVQYSMYQVSYISFVFVVVSLIVYFYHYKMDEARDLILQQQNILLDFNAKLEDQVKSKTAELRELNESLEIKVKDKIEQLIQKDKLLTVQAKQAVMGEMISMIAHQWRQPLSTVTLQISNLQLKRLMGTEVSQEDTNKTLSEISDTIIYLSDTIDDFQTYFHPEKVLSEIELYELLQRAVNFCLPRLKGNNISINIDKKDKIFINTYINELIQVVLIILNNAIDAYLIKDINDGAIAVHVEDLQSKVIISVIDSAGGISYENLPKLFEPYFSTKGKNGTGLGLYMSKMIIEKQFDGKISANNYKDGAIFKIEIHKNIS